MFDQSRLARILIHGYVTPDEIAEICEECGVVDEDDLEVMFEFLERWRPEYDLDYLAKVAEEFIHYPNIERVAAAAFAIAFRIAANSSEARRIYPPQGMLPR